LAYANRHSSPPYRWALALHTLEEGVFWREMINGRRGRPLADRKKRATVNYTAALLIFSKIHY
ncbi:hypothetical protein ACFWMS_29085, partial [Peribacillus butanolivorans]|uniref:hypothetical protein n=1 Tax=Peribacillus butanolivorans TaxID=421767 RepID=UPI00365E4687